MATKENKTAAKISAAVDVVTMAARLFAAIHKAQAAAKAAKTKPSAETKASAKTESATKTVAAYAVGSDADIMA